MVPSKSTMPAAPTPSARASGRSGANARTAPVMWSTISSRVDGVSARRSSTMVPSGSTSATRTLVPPRSTPNVAVSPTSLLAALLADDAVGRVDQRLGRVEECIGRLEDVIAHLRHRAEQLGDHALDDRRRGQRTLLGARLVERHRV